MHFTVLKFYECKANVYMLLWQSAGSMQNAACTNLTSLCTCGNVNRYPLQQSDKYKIKTGKYNF